MRWLPEPRVAGLAPAIEERISHFASLIRAANFVEFLDPLMTRMLAGSFRDAGAHEGMLWLLDSEKKHLDTAWQIGPQSARLLNLRLPLDSGVAGMVLAMQQPFCENNLGQNRAAASLLDEKLGVIVCSRVLVPFFLAGRMRGLVACYQTKPTEDAPDPPGFDPDAVEEMTLVARLLSRLMDHKLLCAATGVEED
jgi:hypothetical protein